VDRNVSTTSAAGLLLSRSPCGGVDRNVNLINLFVVNMQSLPMRGRGSKHSEGQHVDTQRRRSPCGGVDRNFRELHTLDRLAVAPHAGAWIETSISRWKTTGSRVAPHAGAWIETILPCLLFFKTLVAPHAGAWIETSRSIGHPLNDASLPMRGRGSKLQYTSRGTDC